MKRETLTIVLLSALLFSALAQQFMDLATANPIAFLPTIEIKRDGSIVPYTQYIKQDGDIYTLTDNLPQRYTITIQRSNIIFDGKGYTIDGFVTSTIGWSNKGLSLESVTNVTIKDIEVKGFMDADISLQNSNACTLLRVKARLFYMSDSNLNIITESQIGGYDLSLTFSNNNIILRNNITSVSLVASYNNTLFENNFVSKPYWPVSGQNFWDNGSIGNYWGDYEDMDANGDGIGDTPHVINAANQDRYPLINPWHPAIPFDTVPPRISITSPENKIYNDSSVPLVFAIYESPTLMSYSLDGQDNVTITGNTTLSGLPNGSHNLTVYVTDRSGNVGASEIIHFSIYKEPEPWPATPIVAVILAIATVTTISLLYCMKKKIIS